MVDVDNSGIHQSLTLYFIGTIDLDELYEIFKFNKYQVSRKLFNSIFDKIPFGQMNFEEFKSICESD